jgi:hypothetical protein
MPPTDALIYRIRIRRIPEAIKEFGGWDEYDELVAQGLGFVILGNGDLMARIEQFPERDLIAIYALQPPPESNERGPKAPIESLLVAHSEIVYMEPV